MAKMTQENRLLWIYLAAFRQGGLEAGLRAVWEDGQQTVSKTQRKIRKKSGSFRRSDEWRRLRYRSLKMAKGRCQCCGATPESSGYPLHVDHIKPRSRYPELALEFSNLQVLCKDCNFGKHIWDETDWRDIIPETKRGE